ncbi:hypothetical protein MTO96_012007 [Rhipicephalus appendiculatus]
MVFASACRAVARFDPGGDRVGALAWAAPFLAPRPKCASRETGKERAKARPSCMCFPAVLRGFRFRFSPSPSLCFGFTRRIWTRGHPPRLDPFAYSSMNPFSRARVAHARVMGLFSSRLTQSGPAVKIGHPVPQPVRPRRSGGRASKSAHAGQRFGRWPVRHSRSSRV